MSRYLKRTIHQVKPWRYLVIVFLLLFSDELKSQGWKEVNASIGAIRPAFPFSKLAGVLELPIHPLLELGASYQWNNSQKNKWIQDAMVGFGYHRFLQSIVPISTKINYMYVFKNKIETGAFLGAGYLHSFSLNRQYKYRNGIYEPTGRAGKPQFMFRIGVAVKYKAFKLGYENFIQTPFIKSYVPLIPYNMVSLTYSKPIEFFKKEKSKNEK